MCLNPFLNDRATLVKKPSSQSKAKLSRRDARQMQKRLQRVCARRVAHAALELNQLVLVPARDLSRQRHMTMAQSVINWHSKTAHDFELQRCGVTALLPISPPARRIVGLAFDLYMLAGSRKQRSASNTLNRTTLRST